MLKSCWYMCPIVHDICTGVLILYVRSFTCEILERCYNDGYSNILRSVVASCISGKLLKRYTLMFCVIVLPTEILEELLKLF